MRLILQLLLVFLLSIDTGAVLYQRIAKGNVTSFMGEYLERKGINDCFQCEMNEEWLSLKCLRNGELMSVSLQIIPQSVII